MIRLQGVQKRESPHNGKMMINHTIRKESEDKLDQLLNDLEQEWDSIKQSKLRRYSSNIVDEIFQLMDKSPRSIMSSLQQEWKVMNNHDLAVVEILRERREAIESGKLKGRRLFNEPEGGVLTDEAQRESLCIDSEVRSVCSYGSDEEEEEGVGESEQEVSNSTDIADQIEQVVEEGEMAQVLEDQKTTSVVSGGKWIVLVLFIVFALAVSMKSFFGYKDDQVILVPT